MWDEASCRLLWSSHPCSFLLAWRLCTVGWTPDQLWLIQCNLLTQNPEGTSDYLLLTAGVTQRCPILSLTWLHKNALHNRKDVKTFRSSVILWCWTCYMLTCWAHASTIISHSMATITCYHCRYGPRGACSTCHQPRLSPHHLSGWLKHDNTTSINTFSSNIFYFKFKEPLGS